ncbi:hypothetical protein [Candidatus Poriferisodalis sp.]|uniref:hypothetical protein n=1 Tax=Candidatus Poriferisodalis sp. TaxID=3101277 RepID=UPI003B02C54B
MVHAFIVSNARAQADIAASEALRAAWRVLAVADLHRVEDPASPGDYVDYTGPGAVTAGLEHAAHPDRTRMLNAADDAVAHIAADSGGWRWWTPNAARIHSSWCGYVPGPGEPYDPALHRPEPGHSGWTRIVVSGEVVGPLAVMFPDRFDTVYAVAQGPALPAPVETDPDSPDGRSIPNTLPPC